MSRSTLPTRPRRPRAAPRGISLFLGGALLGCTLDADPKQFNGVPLVIGAAQQGADGAPAPLNVDLLRLSVSGEFGIITAEGDPATGIIALEVPAGPARTFQLTGSRLVAGLPVPVLFGAVVADVTPGINNQISIPAQEAGGLVMTIESLLGGVLSQTLRLIALDAPPEMPGSYTLSPNEAGFALPLGRYQIDPASLPPGLLLPPGEDLLLLPTVGEQIDRVVALLAPGEPASLSLTVEGLSLRVRVLDAAGDPVPFNGQLSLQDATGLVANLPSLVNLNGEETLIGGVLSLLPGLFGTLVIHAELPGGRVKGTLAVPVLDLLPGGAPRRITLTAPDPDLLGGSRPEPGDLVLSVVDLTGRVAESFNGEIDVRVSGPGFVRSGRVTVVNGFALIAGEILPTGDPGTLSITATAPGLDPDTISVEVQ